MRGATNAALGKSNHAKKDFQKAIELDPSLTDEIKDMASRSGLTTDH